MCDGNNVDQMVIPIAKTLRGIGYSKEWTNILIQEVLNTRRDYIEIFLNLMDGFTTKDIELKRENSDEEINITDSIVKKFLDGENTQDEMIRNMQIYFIQRGYSINYVIYAINVINADVQALLDAQNNDENEYENI